MVTIALRIHLFSFRTQKLSSAAPKVLGGQPPGRIGCCHIIFLDSSAAEHPAVNRRVVGSNPTRGAKMKDFTNTNYKCSIVKSFFFIIPYKIVDFKYPHFRALFFLLLKKGVRIFLPFFLRTVIVSLVSLKISIIVVGWCLISNHTVWAFFVIKFNI